MEIHLRKLEAVKAVVDTSEPQYMHHLDHNAKKAERDAERQLEIEQVAISDILMRACGCMDRAGWWASMPAACRSPPLATLDCRRPRPVFLLTKGIPEATQPIIHPPQENARLFNKLSAIEDFDSTKVLRASVVRSSLNSK